MSRSRIVGGILAAVVVVAALGIFLGIRYFRHRKLLEPLPTASLENASSGYKKLISDLRAEIEREPLDGDRWGDMGYGLMANGERAKAVGCFARAEELSPYNPAWPHMWGLATIAEDRSAAQDAFRRAISKQRRGTDFSTYGVLVESLIADGNHKEATEVLKSLPINRGDSAHRDFLEAQLELETGNIDSAIKAAESAKTNAPRRRDVHQLLTQLYGQKKDDENLKRERRILELLPEDVDRVPWPDSFSERMLSFTRDINTLAATMQAFTRLGRAGEVISIIESLPADEQSDPRILAVHASTLMGMGDNAGAKAKLELAKPHADKIASVPFALGTLALLEQEFKQAEAYFAEVLRIEPKMHTAHFNRGLCFVQMNKLNEALAEFDQALKHNPSNVDALRYSAYALVDLKRKPEARKRVEDWLLLEPNSEHAKEMLAICDDKATKN